MPVFIKITVYFIIHIDIISSIISPIIVTLISFIIAPFYERIFVIKIFKFIFIITII